MNKRGHVLNAVLLSIGLGYVLDPSGGMGTVRTVAAVSIPLVLGALFPDVDTAFGKHRKTLHNLPVLAVFLAYPLVFANLQWVWLGVLSHYVLDLLGTTRGLALAYPLLSKEFDLPIGVPVSSTYSEPMMVVVTAFELAVIAVAVHVLPAYLPPSVATQLQALLEPIAS
jgi:membrane-bound metal-dependent hydrolase YbcI (DUF457 family)